MPDHRQSVREYVRASEALLQPGELSDEEMEAVQEMLTRLSKGLPNSGDDGKPYLVLVKDHGELKSSSF